MDPAYKEILQRQKDYSSLQYSFIYLRLPSFGFATDFYHLQPIMPDTVEGQRSNLDTPQSPVSISTDSSQRSSSKQACQEKGSEPPTPTSNSSVIRLARKRAASLNTESANHPRIGDLALSSASSSGPLTSDPTIEQVCLCQPDPKIPRPRNGV
jgi:hypothetical protein